MLLMLPLITIMASRQCVPRSQRTSQERLSPSRDWVSARVLRMPWRTPAAATTFVALALAAVTKLAKMCL
jgi:hypothetical protein